MTALDTNVLVRFLVRDDERQAAKVLARFKRAEREREAFFIPLLVVLELLWVLESVYGRGREEILDALSDLRLMSILAFECDPLIQELVTEGRRHGGDLSDLMIALSAHSNGCEAVMTFDRKAGKLPFFTGLD